MLTPGAAGPPDTGVILQVLPPSLTAGGMPLAMTGDLCQMINSVTGAPYLLPIGPLASAGVKLGAKSLVRMGDRIPSGPGVLTILGPPAAPYINDSWPP